MRLVRLVKLLAIALLILAGLVALYIRSVYVDLVGILTHNDTIQRQSTEWIVIHHDDIPRDCDLFEIQANHLERWHDWFPYTIYCKGGKIYQTRGLDIKTSHAIGRNSNGIGVCIHTPDKQNIIDQINLLLVVWYLQIHYDIPSNRVVGHGEVEGNNTDCPQMDMEKFRSYLLKNTLKKCESTH